MHAMKPARPRLSLSGRTSAAGRPAQDEAHKPGLARSRAGTRQAGDARVAGQKPEVAPADRRLLLLNKPYMVLCQFTDEAGRETLKDYIKEPGIYAAGRLDRDSEGLLLLTNCGKTQHLISDPRHKMAKTYWVQLEGAITDDALTRLQQGVQLNDGLTLPAQACRIETPDLWPRNPPVRYRAAIPTSWISLTINEGRNRQVRRMTAAVGFPTLRLIRAAIGPWQLDKLAPGEYRQVTLNPRPTNNTGQHQ